MESEPGISAQRDASPGGIGVPCLNRMKTITNPRRLGRIPLLCLCLSSVMNAGEARNPLVVDVKKWKSESWQPYETLTVDQLPDHASGAIGRSRFGGRMDRREKASGFFHVKKVEGGWTFVDPEGYHFFCVGVNSVASNDDNPDTCGAFHARFGDHESWALKTHSLLKETWGFNSLACWSSWEEFNQAGRPIPYMRRWNMIANFARMQGTAFPKYGHTGFEQDVIPVFDPAFPDFCDKIAKGMQETSDDPWLIGHFSDNELPLKESGILKRYLALDPENPNHRKAAAWLEARGKTRNSISREDDGRFAELVIRTYYQVVSRAMRKHDPNHLFLGTRFHGGVSQQDVSYRASGPYVDVVSVNYYHRWTPEQRAIDRWAELAAKPVMITEWYAKGEDSGLDNSSGAGFTVRTQRERGYFYENFTIGLLRNPNVIGWNWFRYIDDGPSKKGKSCNKGIVNLGYEPWQELVESMRAVNHDVYRLRDFLLTAPSSGFHDQPMPAQ